MRKKKQREFEHRSYSLGISLSKELFPGWMEINPEDQEIMTLLEKKFIRKWKQMLRSARSQVGPREFNRLMAEWLEKAK